MKSSTSRSARPLLLVFGLKGSVPMLLDTSGRLKALPSLKCHCPVGSRKMLSGRFIRHWKYPGAVGLLGKTP
ncbi:hypothetical protein NDU88_008580 [Pleurodeles waltl]|uniref:Secreted protein n=1 Tax=Pleurodeles waltl TaxID=8319 RepID=A0AAV7RY30_PLEWA|nr:hypothetical protein NDU88_008580 [Pleurodeles waltl]